MLRNSWSSSIYPGYEAAPCSNSARSQASIPNNKGK